MSDAFDGLLGGDTSPVASPSNTDTTFTVQPQSQTGTAQTAQTTLNQSVDTPGILALSFGVIDLAISQTNLQLHRVIPGATPAGSQIPVVMPARGSIIGIAFRANANKTAGTATWTAFIGGTAQAATLAWANSTNKGQTLFPRGTYGFSAGQELDVRVTTDGSYAPTTTDIEVILYVFLDPSTAV